MNDRVLVAIAACALASGCAESKSETVTATQTVATTVTTTATTTAPAPTTTESVGATGPLSAQVRRWKKVWCNLKPGMPRKQVLKRMGEPNYVGSEDSDFWSGYGWDFSVEYNLENRARSLDWTSDEGETLPCADVRP